MLLASKLSRGVATATAAGRRTFATSDVFIVSAKRTPVGAFRGALASVPATELGSQAIKAAIEAAGLKPGDIEDVYMGNVCSAGLGQAPARQAAIGAGIPVSAEATTVNKVCASGMKAITLAAQAIMLGQRDIMVAGGMESMSNVPYYMESLRGGAGYGHARATDGILKDGLWDVYNNIHMGNCAEETAAKLGITREMQDEHAVESYRRAAAALKAGLFAAEITPVAVAGPKGKPSVTVTEDEEPGRVRFDKIPSLRPAFQKEGGTVTAANSSKLNDGASALVLMSGRKVQELGIKPLARIRGFSDGAQAPKDFPTAPSIAVPRALKMAGLGVSDISLHEINEAFSVVVRANEKLLGLDPATVNVAGGAVALGHPIGSSGSRIVVTLTHLLKSNQAGTASICNGGGGATAIVIEKL